MYRSTPIAVLFLLLATSSVYAQGISHTSVANSTHPTTLAQVLSLSSGLGSSRLVVPNPDQVLAQGATLPEDGATVSEIAAAFGRITHEFGGMTVPANPTMTVTVAPPSEVDIDKDLAPPDVFKFLLSSLDSGQWKMLVGKNGLGMADLTSDRQRDLFHGLLPTKATIRPMPRVGTPPTLVDPDMKDVTDLLPQFRLRFIKQVDISVPTLDHSTVALHNYNLARGVGKLLETGSDRFGVQTQTHPEEPRPTMLKPGMLAWDSPAMDRSIVVSGTVTVDEVLRRASAVLGTELAADGHFGSKQILFSGPPRYESVPNILKAVCYGTGSTFRQVGPVYLLTENLVGFGTNRRRWDEYSEDENAKRQVAVADAAHKIGKSHSSVDLSWFQDSLSQNPEQALNTGPDFAHVDLKFDDLTPGQKAEVQYLGELLDQSHASFKKRHPSSTFPGTKLDLSVSMTVEAMPMVELVIPGEIDPLPFSNLNYSLIHSGPIFQQNNDSSEPIAQIRARQEAIADSEKSAATKLESLLPSFRRRAALVHPRNASEIAAIVHSMHQIGLNEMWVDVFSNGKSHLTERDAQSGRNILDEALRKCKGTGIQIWPVLNLLQWGQVVEPNIRDLSILGEDSLQYNQHFIQRTMPASETASDVDSLVVAAAAVVEMPIFRGLYVDQNSARVIGAVASAVKQVGRNGAIAGVVWTDTVVPGYDRTMGDTERISSPFFIPAFGYNLRSRLTFLRREHRDPIDIALVGSDDDLGADSIFADKSDNGALLTKWYKFRSDSNIALLRYLRSLVPNKEIVVSLRNRILIPNGEEPVPAWFGSWDTPNSPLPAYHSPAENAFDGQADLIPPGKQARMQSRASLITLTPHRDPTAGWLAAQLSKVSPKSAWDGFVIDLTPQFYNGHSLGISDTDPNPLAHLAEDIRAMQKGH